MAGMTAITGGLGQSGYSVLMLLPYKLSRLASNADCFALPYGGCADLRVPRAEPGQRLAGPARVNRVRKDPGRGAGD
jgi:hypothetical protein